MNFLFNNHDIAVATNDMPTVLIDLADANEYGISSKVVRIDNGTFRDGTKYYVEAKIKAYCDEKKFTFSAMPVGISSTTTYHDVMERVALANAPIIHTNEDVLLVVINSNANTGVIGIVLHTGDKVAPHCSTPLTFIDDNNDATASLMIAEMNGAKFMQSMFNKEV